MMEMMLTMSSLDRAGHTLAGRYRLLRPLAAGSSGRTYLAEDTQLGRRVAVKVLHDGLAGDDGFLERFRAEARAVASLNHPNIVTLFDWGERPVPFMVFELLTGGSLAALLRDGHRLTPAQAVHVGRQVTAALEHAHAQGLVHRDVKPANLLFDDRRTVRVADFGLARALAESGATEPLDSESGLVGTVRYAAPEQADGHSLDGRADLYSLSLVLCEAVTGEVPLTGETPLATLTARADRPLEAPVELGALGVVVERAGSPHPVERYADAAAMSQALDAAGTMLPEAEPVPLAGLGVDLDEPEPTELARRRPAHTSDPADPDSADPARRAGADPPPAGAAAAGATGIATGADTLTDTSGAGGGESGGSRRVAPARAPGSRRLVPWVLAVLVSGAMFAAAYAWNQASTPVVHAPNLVGQSEEAASATLSESGLLVRHVRQVQAGDPAGTVVDQDPEAGSSLERGGEVTLVVSTGPEPVALPAVDGRPEQEAVQALRDSGFEVTVERRFHGEVPPDAVISQEPSDAEAPPGSVVRLVVSDGPEPVVVPNLVGEEAGAARAALEELGFTVVAAEEYSDSVEKGKVIRHDPVTGAEAVPGSEVTLIVSQGPDRVLIPDVRGLTIEEATREVESVGLEVDVVGYSPGALVKRQDPEGDLMLERGRTVTLFL